MEENALSASTVVMYICNLYKFVFGSGKMYSMPSQKQFNALFTVAHCDVYTKLSHFGVQTITVELVLG